MPGALLNPTFDSPTAETLASDTPFWQLYDSSFPSNEREPRDIILESIRRRVAFVVRARSGSGTVALASAHMVRKPAVLFLVYLTVAPEFRSRHIGSALFEKAWTTGAERYFDWSLKPLGLIWEVDIPECASDEENLRQRQRRIAFFGRLGASVLPQPYVQPPVDGITSVAMHLMFRPAPGGSLPEQSALSAMIRGIYFEKYEEANRIPRPVLEELLRKTGHCLRG